MKRAERRVPPRTAQVLRVSGGHDHNARAAAEQEYKLAERHFTEVVKYRDCTNPDHQRRFDDALGRR